MRWKKLIAELQESGLTQAQIAAACDCRQGTISAIATGKTRDPLDSTGRALQRLLRKRRRELRNTHDASPPPRNVRAAEAPIHP